MKKFASAVWILSALIDLAFAQPLPEILGRDVEVDDLIGLPDDPVRHRLSDRHPELAFEHVVERLDVLHVDGGDHVDPFVEQQQDVLPSLAVPRARHVRVRELIDERYLRPPSDHRVDVHLLERDAAVLDLLAGDDLEVADLREGLRAPVRLDEPDDDVHASAPQVVRLLQHAIRLARAGRRTDVDLELASLSLPNERKKVRGACRGRHIGPPRPRVHGGATRSIALSF